MNYRDYIKDIKTALEIEEVDRNNLDQLEQCRTKDSEDSDNAQLNTFINECRFFCAFIKPLYKACDIIDKRINKERRVDFDSFNGSYSLMTVEEVFDNMAHDISFDTARYIVNNRLNCGSFAKSELLRSIKERNQQLFKNTIKEYCVDYKPASNFCYEFCFYSNIIKEVNRVWIEAEQNLKNDLLEENIPLIFRAYCENHKSIINNSMREIGYSEEYITEVQLYLSNLTDDFFGETLIESFCKGVNYLFLLLLFRLRVFVDNQELNDFDKPLIYQFVKDKREQMPIVQDYFTSYTIGDLFGDNFDVIKSDNNESLKLIDQIFLNETNERQMLANDDNVVSNPETVESPNIEDLPLPSKLAYGEEQTRGILMRAIQERYMKLVKVGHDYKYNWSKSNALLVYFCGCLCCGDYTKIENGSYRNWVWGDGEELPRTELSKLFLVKGSGHLNFDKRSTYKRDNTPSPKGSEEIDKLIKNE